MTAGVPTRKPLVINGEVVSKASLSTASKGAGIVAKPEKDTIIADRRDLCFIPITITDKDGNQIFDADYELTCRVYKGKLLAFFSGNPKSEDVVSSNKCHTFEGHALAIVSADTPDDVFVTFYGEGVAGQTVKITAI